MNAKDILNLTNAELKKLLDEEPGNTFVAAALDSVVAEAARQFDEKYPAPFIYDADEWDDIDVALSVTYQMYVRVDDSASVIFDGFGCDVDFDPDQKVIDFIKEQLDHRIAQLPRWPVSSDQQTALYYTPEDFA